MTLAPPELLAYLKPRSEGSDEAPQSIEEKAASPYARSRFDAAMGLEGTKALLEQLGYHSAERHRGYWLLTRPGKGEGEGHSVSVGQIAPWVVKVFSSNDPYFAEEQTVDAHTLYALTHYEGDLQRAEQDFIASYGGLPWPSEGSQELAEGLEAFRAHAEEEIERVTRELVVAGESPWDALAYSTGDLDKLPPLEWDIEGWLPRGGFNVLYGERKHGKTFVALSMALQLATGGSWLGYKIPRPLRVAYLIGEGIRGYQQRVRAWIRMHGYDPDCITFVNATGKNLRDPATVASLIPWINHHGFEVVFVDTINRLSGGMRENDADAMGEFISAIDTIRALTDATLNCVHHTGKDPHAGMRGHSSLEGAVDAGILVTRPSRGLHRVKLALARDVEDGQAIDLAFHEVEGTTSGTIVAAPHPEATEDRNPDARRVMRTLRRPMTLKELKDDLGLTPQRAGDALDYLERTGAVWGPDDEGLWHPR